MVERRVLLTGTEELTLELQGTLPAQVGRWIVGAGVDACVENERVEVSLLIFRMKGLKSIDLPTPGLDYREALWRISINYAGGRAWFAKVCDLDSTLVRLTGGFLVKYPVRTASIALEADAFRCNSTVHANRETLRVETAATGETPAPVPPRRIVVREGAALFEIPWEEIPTQQRMIARVNVPQDTLSEPTLGAPVVWAPVATFMRGRTHRCGLAHRV
jgi:hypothetical protein